MSNTIYVQKYMYIYTVIWNKKLQTTIKMIMHYFGIQLCSSPVKTCKAYIPKRPRFEEPISSSSGSSNGDFDGGYFPSGKFTNFTIDDLIR